MSNSIFGYARTSTPKQSIERQIRNIKAYCPTAAIISEAYTGTTFQRKDWENLYTKVRENDTIIFDSVSRMSRSAEEGFAVYMDLYNRGVHLIFLKEPHINTNIYRNAIQATIPMTGTNVDHILSGVNVFLLELAKEQIKLAFGQAEKEVQDLRQRTKEGLQTARLHGKRIGLEAGTKLTTKKSIASKELIRKHSVDFGGGLNDAEMMRLTGLARNTYYKYKRELKEC